MYIRFIAFQQDVCLGQTVSRSISIMDLASKKIKLVFWWANHWKVPLNLVNIKFARTWLENITLKSWLFPPTNWCAHQFWPHTCKWPLRLRPIIMSGHFGLTPRLSLHLHLQVGFRVRSLMLLHVHTIFNKGMELLNAVNIFLQCTYVHTSFLAMIY